MAQPVSHSPSLAAREFLRKNIGSVWPSGTRLPTLHTLAHQAGVGICTMAGAVKEFADSGVLTVKRREGIHVGGKPARAAGGSKRGLRRDSVAAKLLDEVATGQFPTGSVLPSMKQLAQRYGTGYRVVRHAVDTLLEQGLLESRKREVQVRRLVPERPGASLAVLVDADYGRWRGWEFAEGRLRDLALSLEASCADHRIRLDFTELSEGTALLPALNNPIAVVLFTWDSMVPLLGDLTSQALSYRVPVVVVNNLSPKELRETLGNIHTNSRLFALSLTHQALGHAVGRYLLTLGHRNICYIADNREEWRMGRLAGIRQSYEALGNAAAISTYFADDHPPPASRGANRSEKELDRLRRMLTQAVTSLSASPGSCGPFEHHRESVLGKVLETRYMLNLSNRFRQVFEESLTRSSDATAWVLADNYHAVYGGVLAFLKERGVRVPSDISVASMGNYMSSLAQHLTSCDDNFRQVVPMVMSIALNPYFRARLRKRGGSIEVEGRVVPRGTCRQLHSRK